MCNRYEIPSRAQVQRCWGVENETPAPWPLQAFPRSQGPFMRRTSSKHPSCPKGRELVVGQWALIPWFAKAPHLPYPTNNARSEELEAKASYKQPWALGQRCIIPAASFDEPNWESGKNVWWRFRRADGAPWGLAGLWNTWIDKATGEVHESYTMLTINADQHPLMRRMHKTNPKRPADAQDKRSVVPIERDSVDQWLTGTQKEAQALLQLAPVEVFDAVPLA